MGLGFWELVLVLMVGLIVFGPARLPELARTLAKAVRGFQRGMSEVKGALEDAESAARYPPDQPAHPPSPARRSPATAGEGGPPAPSADGSQSDGPRDREDSGQGA